MKIKLTDTLFLRKGKWILNRSHQTKVLEEWSSEKCNNKTHYEKYMSHFPGVKTFQLFHDKKDGSSAMILHNPSKSELIKYNRKGYGVYLTVNETDGKGRKKENVTNVRAVFADLDGAPISPVMEYNPHLVVQSSEGKYHAYWFCIDVPLEQFRELQKSIIARFDADPVCKDLSRVLRVPGFYHHQKAPQPVLVVQEHAYPPSQFKDLLQVFPPIQRKKYSAEKFKPATSDSDFSGTYGESEGNRNHSCIKIIGGCLKRGLPWGDIVSEVWKHAKACSPPLNDKEIEHVLKSGRRYS